MKDSSQKLSALNPETLTDEALDALFEQLEQYQPPKSVLNNIMATVSQLPPFSSSYPTLDVEELTASRQKQH